MAARPKMLFLCQMFPLPVQSGTQHRTYTLLVRLARHFDITFLTLAAGTGWEPYVEQLRRHAARVVTVVPDNKRSALHRAFFKAWYWLRRITIAESADRFYNSVPNITRAIRSELRDGGYDVLFCEYWFWDARIYDTPALKVIDANDVQTMRVERLLERTTNRVDRLLSPWLVRRYREMEAAALRRADMVVATTVRDRAVFQSWAPNVPQVVCTPTGLDTDYFVAQTGVVRDPRNVVFYGALSNPMNRDAAQFLVNDILPHLRRRVPGVRITMVGAFAGPDILDLAARNADVTVTGYVEDVRQPLSAAGVVVCPLRYGYGIRGRVYELMSMSVPLVVTPIAVEGMELESGDGLLVADGADAFAAAVERVLGDAPLRAQLGRRGREIAVERMSIAATYDRLADLLHETVAGARPASHS